MLLDGMATLYAQRGIVMRLLRCRHDCTTRQCYLRQLLRHHQGGQLPRQQQRRHTICPSRLPHHRFAALQPMRPGVTLTIRPGKVVLNQMHAILPPAKGDQTGYLRRHQCRSGPGTKRVRQHLTVTPMQGARRQQATQSRTSDARRTIQAEDGILPQRQARHLLCQTPQRKTVQMPRQRRTAGSQTPQCRQRELRWHATRHLAPQPVTLVTAVQQPGILGRTRQSDEVSL